MLSPAISRVEAAQRRPTLAQTSASTIDQLKSLKELRDSGAIDDEEFQQLKKKILSEAT